jgi:hypothetical protein
MKTRMHTSFESFVIAVVLAGFLSGCSLAGFLFGNAIDKAKHDRDTVAVRNLEKLPRYDRIDITMKNTESMQGKFVRLQSRSNQEYAEAYDQFRRDYRADSAFPRLGDTLLTQSYSSDSWIPYEFMGFETGGICARSIPQGERTTLRQYDLQSVRLADGTSIYLAKWAELVAQNDVPLTSSVVIKNDSGEVFVNLNDVRRIERAYGGSHAKWIGLGIGICGDVLFIVAGMNGWFESK